MKKKGFTLIELLAVIVVLAIIALIATPIVMNTIKNSKKGAAERTADNYVEQVETSLMTYRMNNNESLPDGEYTIDENGNLTGNEKTLTIEMNGTKPSSGTVVIDNGQVKKDGTTMKVGDYTVTYDTTNKTFVASKNTGNDVEVLCKAVTELSTQFVYDQGNIQTGVLASDGDPYAYGVEYTCELGDNDSKTFYVLENNDDTVSLIMNMNIDENGKGTTSGNTVAWISEEDYFAAGGEINENDEGFCQYYGYCITNDYGPVTALTYLKSSTTSWTKLDPSQISLPSDSQLAKAGVTTQTWYYENLNSSNAPYGYWTSAPDMSTPFSGVYMTAEGTLYFHNADSSTYNGIRPVITLSKSQLG